MLDQFLDLGLMLRFGFGKMGREFLDLGLMLRFGFGEMVADFFDVGLVASFSLCQELTVELLDLANSFWNGRVQPADRSRQQSARLHLGDFQSRWCCRLLPCG